MKKNRLISGLLALAMLLSLAACGSPDSGTASPAPTSSAGTANGIYTPGTYQGTSENGMGGKVTVEVTVDANTITNVTVAEHAETPGISDPAIEQIPTAIVEANSTEVEAVSSATITSTAICEAVDKALAVARGEAEPESSASAAPVSLPFESPDVIVSAAALQA